MSTTHVAAGEGKSVWIGDRELVTFKTEGKDTGGAFALLELVGLPGSGPPPHIHHSVDETYCLLEGELEVLEERDDGASQDVAVRHPGGLRGVLRGGGDTGQRPLLPSASSDAEGL